MVRPTQRVILYRQGLPNTAKKRAAIKAKERYREKSGKEYITCPGDCGGQITKNRYGSYSRHYSDKPNFVHCSFQGDLNG